MRYMLLIYTDEAQDIPHGGPEWEQLMVEYRAFGSEARRRCTFVTGDPLQATSAATTIRMVDGKRVTLDGPFAETREQLGGYYILECSREDAIALASMVPSAKRGSIEVRPLMGHETRVEDPPRQTRYMLMICGVEANNPPDDHPDVVEGRKGHKRFTEYLISRGEFVSGDALGHSRDTVTVRVRDGQTIVTDGPFAETREVFGGFYIFNLPHLDRMLDMASKIPLGPTDCLEIRPLQEV